MLKNDHIDYITFHKPTSLGVEKKINGIANAARRIGYKVNVQNGSECKTRRMYLKFMNRILRTKSKFIFFRSLNYLNYLFIFHFLIARLQGKTLIIDVPTPMLGFIYELKCSNAKTWKIYARILQCIVLGPWIFWVFNLVLQNGQEGAYFMIGNHNRTLKIGNGIDIETCQLREKKYEWPTNYLKLVGVAHISYYHGFDRVIKAIKEWNCRKNTPYYVTFDIIGDGGIHLQELKDLVNKLCLQEYIIFHGRKNQEYIENYYSTSHIAVSTLGFFRIGLSEASALKSREYCSVGIPFIATGSDPDFPDNIPFRMVVTNDSTTTDLLSIFETYQDKRLTFTDEDIREYAVSHLSFCAKLEIIGLKKL